MKNIPDSSTVETELGKQELAAARKLIEMIDSGRLKGSFKPSENPNRLPTDYDW